MQPESADDYPQTAHLTGPDRHHTAEDQAMLLNSWSIALFICSAVVIFFFLRAAHTGVRVLRFWDSQSDSQRQIQLENEIVLSATLVEFALALQILSLLLLVLAADSFSHVLAGAMCATGSFLANSYGMPALLIKLAAVFLYGYWLVMHQLDIRSEQYPLVKSKYVYLLTLLPLLSADLGLQTLYLANLSPDIITSCCGVIFSTNEGESNNLIGSLSTPLLVILFYGLAALLCMAGLIILRRKGKSPSLPLAQSFLFLVLWLGFYLCALVYITVIVSSYVYAMPFHNCPFDILRLEYNGIGYPIYLTLFTSVFCATGSIIAGWFASRPGLRSVVAAFQTTCLKISLISLIFFLLLTSYAPILYLMHGGEY